MVVLGPVWLRPWTVIMTEEEEEGETDSENLHIRFLIREPQSGKENAQTRMDALCDRYYTLRFLVNIGTRYPKTPPWLFPLLARGRARS